MNQHDLIIKLHEIDAIKFGSFTLKSGILSPIYLDLRLIVSYPEVLEQVAQQLWEAAKNCSFDLVCGVPYTAMPMATAICLRHNKPMVMRRKEIKEYGTRRVIEGAYLPGQRCLIVEDLVTSGKSVLETIVPLEHERLVVKDVVVLINREQGGEALLAERGYRLHAVFTLSTILQVLEAEGKLNPTTVRSVKQFLTETQLTSV